tara:strand:- start:1565 stop:2596 length:1032 start_codon:yes stop_codon:yes gene_type:complete
MSILVTGAAGFIGFHLCKKLLEEKFEVIGLDNLNSYYDPDLKRSRIKELNDFSSKNGLIFNFVKGDIVNNSQIKKIFEDNLKSNTKITMVINLAAQAGVRYSIDNPSAYIQSNIVGFSNIIEESKNYDVDHFIYASSSSVYGGNKKLPFSETDQVDNPVSLYAATKKSNELIAHTYSHLFKLPTIGLRFFTVYGPWGRPDMALFKFINLILRDKSIQVFNYGKMVRDFTYIDDVIEAIYLLIKNLLKNKKTFKNSQDQAPYRIFNIGNSKPTNLEDYIKAIELNLNKKAKIVYEDMQPGDVKATFANTESLENEIKFKPNTSINVGIKKFINWYISYYKKPSN